MMNETIDSLLEKRQTRRINKQGDSSRARSRIDLSKMLANHYSAYDELRNHLFHPKEHPHLSSEHVGSTKYLTDELKKRGWITPGKGNSWKPTNRGDSRAYLTGGWLEELAFCAHEAAGVDEIYFGQEVEWNVDGVKGKNEIDVIARRGDVLSFTSCKTVSPEKSDGKTTTLRSFLVETDYWNIHFAEDNGRALLVVTADLIDEMRRNSHRYPDLLARAKVLEVSVIGLEGLSWDRMVENCHEHWATLI